MKKTILAIIIALIGSSNLFAQNGGAIRGVVTDENGAKVSGAHVVLNLVPGIQLTTQTNESGVFEYKGLRAGLYLIEVKADGFSEFTSESIRLDRAETKASRCNSRSRRSTRVWSSAPPARPNARMKFQSHIDTRCWKLSRRNTS